VTRTGEVVLPDWPAGVGVPAAHNSADAEGVEPTVANHRRGLGPFPVGLGVGAHLERRCVALRPRFPTVRQPQSPNYLPVVLPGEHEHMVADDHGRGMAGADLHLPLELQFFRPALRKLEVGHRSVTIGSTPLVPVCRFGQVAEKDG
jgi:hypothetical protein